MLETQPSQVITLPAALDQTLQMPKTTENSGCTSMIERVSQKTWIMSLNLRRIRGIVTWLYMNWEVS